MGCPHKCVFCDQKSITNARPFSLEKVKSDIDTALSTINDSETDIAYFGGSFTGIDRSLMISLLDLAEEYVKDGRVKGIRFSTRPDYINDEIIRIIANYSVSEVELGIQSMNDSVLESSERGHTAEDSFRAFELLKKSGIPFGGQMMIGLPQSNLESEIETAELIAESGAVSTRIYPCIVFKNTVLYELMIKGLYTPLSTDSAVSRGAEVLKVFVDRDVNVLRIGLQDNENLRSDDTYAAGPNEPCLGEMIKSRYYFNLINRMLDNRDFENREIVIQCAEGEISAVSGYKKYNKLYLMEKTGTKCVKILENRDVQRYNIIIN